MEKFLATITASDSMLMVGGLCMLDQGFACVEPLMTILTFILLPMQETHNY